MSKDYSYLYAWYKQELGRESVCNHREMDAITSLGELSMDAMVAMMAARVGTKAPREKTSFERLPQ